ncbi:SusC/RagA family TonB-linked outer membrane protein [Spongiimicrobium sp. 3-5]|uniref:SusC/RagA family TonB-linked outer membrane protein n=1 Tax=Spongiimicrobium sp. 3-5 TaxID=3332596 RepID=UPI00397F79A8
MEKKLFPADSLGNFMDKSKELMRYLSLFLLLFMLYSFTNSYSQNTKLKLDLKDATLLDMIQGIEQQSDFVFMYGDEVLPLLNEGKDNFFVKNKNIYKTLDKCLENSRLNYAVNGRQVVLKKKHVVPLKTESVSLQLEVTGNVSDDAGPLPGASIVVKGTTIGTTTDFDGNYSLEVNSSDAILVFSYLGYTSAEIPVNGQTVVNAVLKEDAQALEEVVVTALGFEVKTDKLGSAVATVKAADIVRSGETSITNGIQGKMSGVNITRSNGDPGSGSNIRIRGANTIFGSTQPLIIVDGIPISNTSRQGSGSSATGNGTSQQSRLNDINPNDIATLQVLKGASAAALWGSRASNGVVVITTKSGRRGFKVDFRSTVGFDEVNVLPEIQRNYGQGNNGVFIENNVRSWGDEISARSGGADVFDTSGGFFVGDQTGRTYYPVLQKNSRETFVDRNFDQAFGTGILFEQSLSISGGDNDQNIFLSLGNTDQNGVVRNNDYSRHSVSLNASKKFNDFIKVGFRGKFSRVKANRVEQNSNTAGLLLGLNRTPAGFNNEDFTGTYTDDTGAEFPGRHRSYRNSLGANDNPLYNNPGWTINKQKSPNVVNRHIYAAELDVFPTEGLNLKVRGGIDTYTDDRIYFYPRGSARTGLRPRLEGGFTQEVIAETQLNLDVIARYVREFSENLSTTFVLGWNINDRKFKSTATTGGDFIVNEEIFNFTNSRVIQAENRQEIIRSNRGYATANLELYRQLFLDFSGTVEAASTINDPFFYPSASAAWQFTNAEFFGENDFLSFGKVRASWGKVGIQPDVFRSATNYEGDFSYSSGLFGNLTSVANGGGFRLDNNLGDSNLKPEIKTELEFGLELRFLENKLSTSFSYYTNEVEDILLEIDTSPSSGFTRKYTNGASLENKGFEFEFNYRLFTDNEDWSLMPYGTFATNKNEVTSLNGADVQRLTGFGVGDGVAAVGHQIGALFGGKLPRNDDGSIILDANGFPEGAPEFDVIGDPNPDWTASVGLQASYKNFSFNVLFDHSQGGDFYNITRQVDSQRGHSKLSGNKVTIPSDGILDVTGTSYSAGEVVRGNLFDFGAGLVLLEQNWYRGNGAGNRGFSELWLEDATWTRLREISLSYSFHEGIIDKLGLSGMSVGLTGRNLFLWTDVEGVDPDKNFAGVGNSRGLDYYTNPSTRSILFNVNLSF